MTSHLPYYYIGKDGKRVLARDLEDDRDRLREEINTLKGRRDVDHKMINKTAADVKKWKSRADSAEDAREAWQRVADEMLPAIRRATLYIRGPGVDRIEPLLRQLDAAVAAHEAQASHDRG